MADEAAASAAPALPSPLKDTPVPSTATDLHPPFTTSFAPPSVSSSSSSAAAQPTAVTKLSITERLLIAQVVHYLNESPPDWAKVSSHMLSHPLIKGPERAKAAAEAGQQLQRLFGTRECERIWTALMRENNLIMPEDSEADVSQKQTARSKEAKGPQPKTDRKSQLALAQILYAEKMEELRESIRRKEEEFKSLVQRIDELQSKKADPELQKEIDAGTATIKRPKKVSKTAPVALSPSAPDDTIAEEPATSATARGEEVEKARTPERIEEQAPKEISNGSSDGGKPRESATEETAAVEPARSPSPVADEEALRSGPVSPEPQPRSGRGRLARTRNATSTTATQPEASSSTFKEKASQGEDMEVDEGGESAIAGSSDERTDVDGVEAVLGKARQTNNKPGSELRSRLTGKAETQPDADEPKEEPAKSSKEDADDALSSAPATPRSSARSRKGSPQSSPIQPASSTVSKRGKRKREEKDDAANATLGAANGSGDEADESTSARERAMPTRESKRTRSSTVTTRAATEEVSEAKSDQEEATDEVTATPAAASKKSVASNSSAAGATNGSRPSPVQRRSRRGVKDDVEEEKEDSTPAAGPSKEEVPTPKSVSRPKPAPRRSTRGRNSTTHSREPTAAVDEEEAADDEGRQAGSGDEREASKATKGDEEEEAAAGEEEADTSRDDVSSRRGSGAELRSSRRGSTTTNPAAAMTGTGSGSSRPRNKGTERILLSIVDELSSHTHASRFVNEVRPTESSDYHSLVRQPSSLKSIKAKVKEGSIHTTTQLRAACQHLFANAIMYNGEDEEMRRMAGEMREEMERLVAQAEPATPRGSGASSGGGGGGAAGAASGGGSSSKSQSGGGSGASALNNEKEAASSTPARSARATRARERSSKAG